jgi:hypothetical protein
MSEPWFIAYERAYLARPYQNDAEAYGVRVERAATPQSRAIGVHHLTADENRGLFHVYLDVIRSDGSRVAGIPVGWDWEGRQSDEHLGPVVIDKPDAEPGANIPLHKNQVVSVWVGSPGQGDAVTGLSTAHPDEGVGNTWGHHSFLVVFLVGENGAPAPTPDGWSQLELEGLTYELTNAANAISNAQTMVNIKRRLS